MQHRIGVPVRRDCGRLIPPRPSPRSLTIIGAILVALLLPRFAPTASADINYIYDTAGRLTYVLDGNDRARDSRARLCGRRTKTSHANIVGASGHRARASAPEFVVVGVNSPGKPTPVKLHRSQHLSRNRYSSTHGAKKKYSTDIVSDRTNRIGTVYHYRFTAYQHGDIVTSVPQGATTGSVSVTSPLGTGSGPTFTVP